MSPSAGLLRPHHKDDSYGQLTRTPSAYNPLYSYRLARGDTKNYMQQYGDMYFLRLAKLKPVVESIAQEDWEDFEIASERAQRVERVLDVRQGQLCWVVGTIYMDMPLKPNILEDIAKEHFVAGPPPRHSYFAVDGETQIMLEDESGRLRLTGSMLKNTLLVTGVIVAVLGTENANGDFEVLDMHIPELPQQPKRWERDDEEAEDDSMQVDRQNARGKKIAIVSGLEISGTEADTLSLSMLIEFLLGESLDGEDQDSVTTISRLIIAGNSIASDVIAHQPSGLDEPAKKSANKKYGYDAAAYNPAPTAHLDQFLSELLPSIPITLMAGEQDPANSSLPQQPVHPAMFPHARAYTSANVNDPEEDEPGWFDSVTNPWDGDVEGWRLMGNSGQPVDDILKYIDLGGPDGRGSDGRLEVMESMLKWRCGAPTAPDTLWCYPFQDRDQFVIEQCPHVFFVGNQPRFDTIVIDGPGGQKVRLIAIPRFHSTGELVLLDVETLEVDLIKFDVHDTHGVNGAFGMLINEHVAVSTSRVLLVPYSEHHVPNYHEWMKDPAIQAATASEPLSIDEEYAMQRSWREDADKMTFIICRPDQDDQSTSPRDGRLDLETMIGDVNMFLSLDDDSDKQSSTSVVVGELELMIARTTEQGKGYGRAALLVFLRYILDHQDAILQESRTGSPMPGSTVPGLSYFTVKIGQTNDRSMGLFESLGFVKKSGHPNYFGEFELRLDVRKETVVDDVMGLMQRYGVDGYREIEYSIH